jgi:hypothetical protein
MSGLHGAVYLAVSLLWVVVAGGVAAAAFARFRTTASGLLIGTSCAVSALKTLAVSVLQRALVGSYPFDHPLQVALGTLSLLISAATMAGVAAGVALIPSSLGSPSLRAPRGSGLAPMSNQLPAADV